MLGHKLPNIGAENQTAWVFLQRRQHPAGSCTSREGLTVVGVWDCGGSTGGYVGGAEARLGVPVLQAVLPGSLDVVLRQVCSRQGPRGGRKRASQGGLLLCSFHDHDKQ